jgi:hypothetical protein
MEDYEGLFTVRLEVECFDFEPHCQGCNPCDEPSCNDIARFKIVTKMFGTEVDLWELCSRHKVERMEKIVENSK